LPSLGLRVQQLVGCHLIKESPCGKPWARTSWATGGPTNSAAPWRRRALTRGRRRTLVSLADVFRLIQRTPLPAREVGLEVTARTYFRASSDPPDGSSRGWKASSWSILEAWTSCCYPFLHGQVGPVVAHDVEHVSPTHYWIGLTIWGCSSCRAPQRRPVDVPTGRAAPRAGTGPRRRGPCAPRGAGLGACARRGTSRARRPGSLARDSRPGARRAGLRR